MSTWSGRDEFKARVLEWADKLGVKVHALAIRPMQHKWASCSTAGNLNFNEDLLNLDREVADYVIVHELLHFFAPNHGKLWKSLMRAHLGDYETLALKLPCRSLPLSNRKQTGGSKSARQLAQRDTIGRMDSERGKRLRATAAERRK